MFGVWLPWSSGKSWHSCVTGWWLRGFSWPLQWADCRLTVCVCNGKSCILIHTDGLLWLAAGAQCHVTTAAGGGGANTRQLHPTIHWLFVLWCLWLFRPSPTEHAATVGAIGAVQLTGHTCLPQRHDTVSLHTHLFVCITTTRNTCSPPLRQNLKLLGYHASYQQHYLTCK